MVQEYRIAENQNTPWEMTIYSTDSLRSKNGLAPERVVARQIAESFSRHNRDILLEFDFPDVSLGTNSPTCGDGLVVFGNYLSSGNAPRVAADSNLCLMDAPGGGCADIGGNAAVMGVNHIILDPGLMESGTERLHANTLGAMHEVGHNMGWQHEPHPGVARNSADGYWEKTPTVGNDDTTNMCNEAIPARQHQSVRRILIYHDCVFDHMQIVDKPLLDPANSTPDPFFAYSPLNPSVGQLVTFDARGSYDPDGFITDYEWSIDGVTKFGEEVTATFDAAGDHTVTLTVTDDVGATATTQQTVTVKSAPATAAGFDFGSKAMVGAGTLALLGAVVRGPG